MASRPSATSAPGTDAKARVPIIVITADAGATIEAECRAAGADDLVLKPVSMMALFSAIAALAGRPAEGLDTPPTL
jgi:CheY-like chemotaxis protein